MALPLVSVLIAVHNQEKYIGRCIRSILSQSLKREDYEVIVVNDGSTDRTKFALEVFDKEIRVFEHKEKSGLAQALNTGLKEAKGRYLVRLDGDDYVSSEFLKVLSLFLISNPYMDAVACDYLLVDDAESVLGRKNCLEDPVGCGIMFQIDQLRLIGFYDPQFHAHEDKDLRHRFLKNNFKIHRVELPLYRYRRHENNMTNDIDKMKKFEEIFNQKHKTPMDV